MHCGNINRCVFIRIALGKYKKSRNRREHEKCCSQDRELSGCSLKPYTPDRCVLSILMIVYNLSCFALNSTSRTLSFDFLHNVPYGYYSRWWWLLVIIIIIERLALSVDVPQTNVCGLAVFGSSVCLSVDLPKKKKQPVCRPNSGF